MLIEMMDQHCAEQNKRVYKESEENKLAETEYDFVYVPIDFRS